MKDRFKYWKERDVYSTGLSLAAPGAGGRLEISLSVPQKVNRAGGNLKQKAGVLWI